MFINTWVLTALKHLPPARLPCFARQAAAKMRYPNASSRKSWRLGVSPHKISNITVFQLLDITTMFSRMCSCTYAHVAMPLFGSLRESYLNTPQPCMNHEIKIKLVAQNLTQQPSPKESTDCMNICSRHLFRARSHHHGVRCSCCTDC